MACASPRCSDTRGLPGCRQARTPAVAGADRRRPVHRERHPGLPVPLPCVSTAVYRLNPFTVSSLHFGLPVRQQHLKERQAFLPPNQGLSDCRCRCPPARVIIIAMRSIRPGWNAPPAVVSLPASSNLSPKSGRWCSRTTRIDKCPAASARLCVCCCPPCLVPAPPPRDICACHDASRASEISECVLM